MKQQPLFFIFVYSNGHTFLFKHEDNIFSCIDGTMPWIDYIRNSSLIDSMITQIGFGIPKIYEYKGISLSDPTFIMHLPKHSFTRICLTKIELLRMSFNLSDEDAAECYGVHVSHFKNIKYGKYHLISDDRLKMYENNILKRSSFIKRLLCKTIYNVTVKLINLFDVGSIR